MADNKKYYWLKLKDDFFDQKQIRALRKLPSGDELTIVYLKLMLKSIQNDGILKYERILPAYEAELALAIDEDENSVKLCIGALLNMGIVELFDNNDLYMKAVNEMLGSETDSAQRMRRLRDKGYPVNRILPSQCDVNVTESDETVEQSDTDIDINKNQEKEKRLDRDREFTAPKGATAQKETRHKHGSYKNVLLSDDEFEKLKTEFPNDWDKRIETLSEYIASTGKKYTNFLATIRSWAKNDKTVVNGVSKNQQPDYSDVSRYENLTMDFKKE